MDETIFIGAADGEPQFLDLRMANRHGLVTGATGTGKTVTLQILLEAFSRAGVPSFAADIKGDLSGIAVPGEPKDFLLKRAEQIGLTDYAFAETPAEFWDLHGRQGHPIRTTISEMGPLILARLLELTDVQEGVLNIAFRLADDEKLALLDLKDLRALMVHIAEEAKALSVAYGRVSTASVGAIQRALLTLEEQGGDAFFGEPAFAIADLMRHGPDGRGVANILAADTLMENPRLYATFLLWLLSELFEEMPEVGDPAKPKLVFFFDEAHLLFSDAPKALVDQVERVTRLIRSKGVGIYFVTQNPLDVPDTVLGQLGNRVQHALRAFTPRDQKAVRAAAETFRPNPSIDTAQAITELATGEALTSMLGAKGEPGMVERTLIRPPSGRLGPITPDERAVLMAGSALGDIYRDTVDRESAYEILAQRAAGATEGAPEGGAEEAGFFGRAWDTLFGDNGSAPMTTTQRVARSTARTAAAEAGARLGKAVAGSMGAKLGREIGRGMFGNLTRSR